MRVGADQRVRQQDAIALGDDVGQELEVDLVDDAGPRRHDPEVGERLLAPPQKLVALAVALELIIGIQ